MEYYPIYKEQSSKHERRTHLKANKHCKTFDAYK